jgi:hypothetical protein
LEEKSVKVIEFPIQVFEVVGWKDATGSTVAPASLKYILKSSK